MTDKRRANRRRIERRMPKRGVTIRHDDDDPSKRHRRAKAQKAPDEDNVLDAEFISDTTDGKKGSQ